MMALLRRKGILLPQPMLPAGQGLAGQAEHRSRGVGVVRLNLAQRPGRGLGHCHGQGFNLVLSLLDGDAARAVCPELKLLQTYGGGMN